MYIQIENWLNNILKQEIPQEVVALNFNLYDDGGYNWSLELVGTESFDPEDEDWCCDEIFDFGTREHPYSWKKEANWNDILEEMIQILKRYLEQGTFAKVLTSYQGLGIGFVDGDVEILYVQSTN